MWTTSILTYNIWQTVPEPVRYNGQNERCDHLISYFQDHSELHVDIIVFQELIIPHIRKKIIAAFRSLGYLYHSQRHDALLKLVDGGVVILSKYPIIEQDKLVFKCGTGTDNLSAKGLIYCRILKYENVINIIGTHLQAWFTPKCQHVREMQFREIGKFISKKNFKPDENLILCGDFNVDMYTSYPYIEKLLKSNFLKIIRNEPNISTSSISSSSSSNESTILDFQHPRQQIQPIYTLDPKTNQLVGNDEESMYISSDYPNGCYDEYLKTLQCSCCPQETVDYITYSYKHLCPISTSIKIINVKSSQKFTIRLNNTTTREISDISDHYPVLATLVFDKSCNFKTRKIMKYKTSADNKRVTKKVILFTLVGIIFILLILLPVLFTVLCK